MTTPSIVFDCGSFSTKVGFSTDEIPQVIRTVVGRSRTRNGHPYVGDGAMAVGDSIALSNPVEEGLIENFPDFELLLEFALDAIGAQDQAYPTVFAEPPFNSAPKRANLAELMFERFHVPELNVMLQGILALVGTGRVTGLVVDCGHGGCHTVPIFESYVIPHAIETMNLGGKDLNVLLAKLLALRDIRLAKTSHQEILRDIKENHCFCRPSSDSIADNGELYVPYKLPDGNTVIDLSNERFAVPEAYFSPSLVNSEKQGISAMIANCVKNSPIDLTKPLVSNIILSGGSSQFPGFSNRLSTEVKYRVSSKMSREVKIVSSDEKRNCLVWNGGRAFAELKPSFQERWMTREEYNEYGPDHIHTKVMSSTYLGY